jgi:hypothetical protein
LLTEPLVSSSKRRHIPSPPLMTLPVEVRMLILQLCTSDLSYQFSNEYGSDSNSSSDSIEWNQPEPIRICTGGCRGAHAREDPSLSCSRQARFADDLKLTFNLLFINKQICTEAGGLYNQAEYRFLGVPCFSRFSELMGQTRCKYLRRIRVVDKSRRSWALAPAELTGWLRDKRAAIQEIGARYYGRCAWRDTTRCYNKKYSWRSPRVIMTGFVNQPMRAPEGVTAIYVDDYLYSPGGGTELRYDPATKACRPLH